MPQALNDNLAFMKQLLISIYVAASVLMSYLSLDHEIIFLFSILLGIDFATGVVKAYRLGHSINSNKAKYGLLSKLVLLLIPITLAITFKIVGIQFDTLLTSSFTILTLAEVVSILSNIYSIRTKNELPEFDVVSILANRIKKVIFILAENSQGTK